MDSFVKLSAAATNMEVTIFVMLPLTISIYVITGCGNFRTSCDLFVTSLAVGVAGIAGCAAGLGHSVTDLGLAMVILIDSAVFSATGLALSLGNTGCLAAGVDSSLKNGFPTGTNTLMGRSSDYIMIMLAMMDNTINNQSCASRTIALPLFTIILRNRQFFNT